MATNKTLFETLSAIDVSEHIDHKNDLSYLSWTWAWSEFKKKCPDAHYEIWRDEQGRPYLDDPNLGYMVFTTVTTKDETHSMWLPVMDARNFAMKSVKYKCKRGKYDNDVEPATMFDVNKAIMRCLVKNIAMFGLGLYIYAGEDLPEEVSTEKSEGDKKKSASTAKKTVSTSNSKASTESADESTKRERAEIREKIIKYGKEHNITDMEIANDYGINKESTVEELKAAYQKLITPPDVQEDLAAEFAALDEQLPF